LALAKWVKVLWAGNWKGIPRFGSKK